MVSIEGAARVSGLNEMTIYKLVEKGALHCTQDDEGRVLVCLNSLRR